MYILALALLLQLDTTPPRLMTAPTTEDICMSKAKELNLSTKDLQDPEMRAAGAAFVCLKIIYPI